MSPTDSEKKSPPVQTTAIPRSESPSSAGSDTEVFPSKEAGARHPQTEAVVEEARRMDKKLVAKMDRVLLPFLTLLFLMSFLDRVNIGVAKLAGLNEELGLNSLQYNTASMILFVSYVAFEVPSNLVLKKFRPSRFLPIIAISWGLVQTFQGFVQNYAGLLVCRFLLGGLECSLFPGISLYLSVWYKRGELSLRIALFFSAATMAGALGGILGYGLSKMNGLGGLEGWSWIFIIEGIATVIVGAAGFYFIQDFPDDEPKAFTAEERSRVLQRRQDDIGLATKGTFNWHQIRLAVTDPKTWLYMLMYIGAAEPIYSQSIFSPTIVRNLGKWTTSESLLLTVPPYVLAFITTVSTALLIDRYGHRAFFMMFWSALSTIGYILLVTIPISKPGVLYFAVFLTVAAIAPSIATTISWTGGNFGNHYKKATAMGMVFSLGNSGGIVSSQIYRTQDAPSFRLGHGITLGFCAMSFVCATLLYFHLKRENARRDAAFGPPPKPLKLGETHSAETLKRLGLEGKSEADIIELGDYAPDFRYLL